MTYYYVIAIGETPMVYDNRSEALEAFNALCVARRGNNPRGIVFLTREDVL